MGKEIVYMKISKYLFLIFLFLLNLYPASASEAGKLSDGQISSAAHSASDDLLRSYEREILGVWVSGDSMYIVDPRYVLYIPSKSPQGKDAPKPAKYAYALTSEASGYYFRSMRWYRIEGVGNEMRMDNRKFLLRIGFIKLFSYDGGGVLNKISDVEALKRLEDYNLDFDYIKNLPIQPHQNIANTAKNFDEIPALPKDSKGFLIDMKDNSLPEILKKFLKTKKKIN